MFLLLIAGLPQSADGRLFVWENLFSIIATIIMACIRFSIICNIFAIRIFHFFFSLIFNHFDTNELLFYVNSRV